ncbi:MULTISPECIES: cysteine hydrolase family protein [Mycobacterium avium complex (MAC)]|uniref:cysteine hydrolase family protein n=1 Tax=Mycobacterium avium complex (MAC) TaxID=120793 RepID=UPI0004B8C01E|nr:isochorismatase family cysteine hydrolase [Mycobacterium intracellulare]MCA2273508.1 cysteine hydrolase [Mycobacterium intracellulare]MCA2326052.1 cysteine hydrolase [Mycobacterium intracellulare]UEB24799.1 cysteine hydrolase [Mycobacterium intracellulare]BCO60191.1 cysteine hydrolase [Mycobacterium intracellulare]BCO70808.1 cysteine hydrolase [Mycobacterium intracellulare]
MPTENLVGEILLVLDMQNSFCHEKGSMYEAMGAPLYDLDKVVENTVRVVAAARDNGVPVVFTRHQYLWGHADFGAQFGPFRDHLAATGGLLGGSWDADVIDALECSPRDLVIPKARLDAFHNTGLDTLLRSMAADRLTIVGIVTNACVETTARAAVMRDYSVTVVADCTTSAQQRYRDISLEFMEAFQIAQVSQSSELPYLCG